MKSIEFYKLIRNKKEFGIAKSIGFCNSGNELSFFDISFNKDDLKQIPGKFEVWHYFSGKEAVNPNVLVGKFSIKENFSYVEINDRLILKDVKFNSEK